MTTQLKENKLDNDIHINEVPPEISFCAIEHDDSMDTEAELEVQRSTKAVDAKNKALTSKIEQAHLERLVKLT